MLSFTMDEEGTMGVNRTGFSGVCEEIFQTLLSFSSFPLAKIITASFTVFQLPQLRLRQVSRRRSSIGFQTSALHCYLSLPCSFTSSPSSEHLLSCVRQVRTCPLSSLTCITPSNLPQHSLFQQSLKTKNYQLGQCNVCYSIRVRPAFVSPLLSVLTTLVCENDKQCCKNMYCRGAVHYKDNSYSAGQCKREEVWIE